MGFKQLAANFYVINFQNYFVAVSIKMRILMLPHEKEIGQTLGFLKDTVLHSLELLSLHQKMTDTDLHTV